MIIITVLNIVVVILAFLARSDKYRFLLALAFLLLAFVLGIRFEYGNDYLNYKYIYVHGEADDAAEIEPGWLLLMYLFRPVGFYGFVFGLSVIEHLMLWDIIRRHLKPNYYWLATFFYVFNADYMLIGLSMMRQFLVMLLGFYALEMSIKKKIIPFFFIISCGFFIHKMSLLYLPLLGLPYVINLFSSKWMFLVLFVSMIIVFISMMQIIEIIIPIINDSGELYAARYLNDKVLNDNHSLGRRYIIQYAVYMFYLIRNYKNLFSSYEKCVALEVILGCFFLPFFNLFFLAIRLAWMFTIAEIISFPLLISKEKKMFVKYMFTFAYMLFVVVFEYRYIFYSETYGKYYQVFRTIFSAP